jgi:cytochrome c-type biogenesis protein CcsB
MILSTGLFARKLIQHPAAGALLQQLGQDLIRTSKVVDSIQSAMTVSDPRFLAENLRLIPPPGADLGTPWHPVSNLVHTRTPADEMHAGLTRSPQGIPGLSTDVSKSLTETWTMLQNGWRAQDAAAVNEQVSKLAELLPRVAPSLYPSAGRLEMESWYFRYKSMTWVWLLYLAALVPLLMSVIYKWDRARTVGMVLFIVAFLAQTASVGIRWYISGRWPNSNMFEALTTSAWFGGVAAIVLERVARRTPFRNLFALGSAVVSMAALMAAYFLPAQLDSAINNKMAALNDVWLYIHTNMIIWSYAVIGLACVPALLSLRHRWCLLWDREAVPKARLLILPLALGILNYTGYVLLMQAIDPALYGFRRGAMIGIAGAFTGALMIVVLEALNARARSLSGASLERGASGGAASMILGSATPQSFLRKEQPSITQVFDGATMVLVELAFIMLWTGLVMGAIWADHSWGRPWGWDPKEVFALNTFIIFLILIHVRLKVRDKALWTAILAVVGFEVMMFNWIVVNFIISGLHSYA